MIVVDASVAVKWLLPEPGHELAHQLGAREDLAAPALIRTEVAAAIARKARLREIQMNRALEALEIWAGVLAGDVQLSADADDLPRALQLAVELDHPLQDCLYLALAERLEVRMVTADKKFAAKARIAHARVEVLR